MISLSQDLDFSGKRVLITGAANGFGAAMADLFAAHGAKLALADIECTEVEATAQRLGAQAYQFDQADQSSIERLSAAVGAVDVLINNAGILVAKPLLETEAHEIRRLVDVDFVGVVLMMRHFGKAMVEQKRGVILNLSSQTAFAGGENRGVYAAAKAAVSQITRATAVEWGAHGVRVLALAPGRCLTRMTKQTAAPGYTGDRGLSRVPLGRWGTPEEIAKMALMLCSDAASYVTGETIIADGGYVIG
jgi:NAD(P)-dependent dehydrogenase (short-subunit alcohol dehydrogenase family)